MNKVVASVSSKATQLETLASSYKDTLLKALTHPTPSYPAPQRSETETLDPTIDRDVERKSRQVLIDFTNDQFTSLSEVEIKSRLYDAILKVSDPPAPKDLKILKSLKLRNNRILVLFDTKEAAD